MVVPKRVNKYRQYKERKELSDLKRMKCKRQFPDCPEKPNKENCNNCPFYKEEKMDETKQNEEPKIEEKPKKEKGKTLEIIKQTLGESKMKRKELREKSGLTQGQIAGAIHRSRKTNDVLKFENGLFFIKND